MTTTQVKEPQTGDIIHDHYVIESELGRGGFGVVFKARHLTIDREVAIKVLLATYAKKDASALDRFRREATIAASLSYPNTVRIFDYGETGEGVFYLIMEMIRGRDLSHTIAREGRLAPVRAVHIIRQVLHAMMEAHARGIVHRDIKPDNVMLVPLAYDADHVKVMDFGIAKMAKSDAELTQQGLTLGTPRYMPVEQLRDAELGPATDLYAVGLVLYEMMVGAPAFKGETAVDAALAVMRGDSLIVPRSAKIPEALCRIIEKASAKQPEDRYQSARAFLEALDGLGPDYLASAADDVTLAPVNIGEALAAAEAESEANKTLAMPGLDGDVPEGGDFEDATRTVMIPAVTPPSAVDHSAKTMALSVDEIAGGAPSDAAQAAKTLAVPAASMSTTEVAVDSIMPRETHAPQPAPGSEPTAPSSSLSLALQIATLAAVVALIIVQLLG